MMIVKFYVPLEGKQQAKKLGVPKAIRSAMTAWVEATGCSPIIWNFTANPNTYLHRAKKSGNGNPEETFEGQFLFPSDIHIPQDTPRGWDDLGVRWGVSRY